MSVTGRMGMAVAALFVSAGAGAFAPAAVAADVVYRARGVTCVSTTSEVRQMAVDGLRFGIGREDVWAQINVHLTGRDGRRVSYKVRGTAYLLPRALPANGVAPTFAHAGVSCSVSHPAVKAVQNCRRGAATKSCDVGLSLASGPRAYAVSISVEAGARRTALAGE